MAASNRAVRYAAKFGDADAAFAKAEYTRKEKFACHRQTGCRWRRAARSPSGMRGRLTVFGATKVLFFNRRSLAPMLGVTEADIDMIEVDVGGGFGVKGEFYPEDFLIPFAARLVGRPVKWIEDRREHLIATNHSREVDCELEIACKRDGTILAMRGHIAPTWAPISAPMAAWCRPRPAQFLPGPYRITRHRADGGGVRHQQDAGRDLARAGAVRGEFFPRADARYGGGRPRPRRDGVPPEESDQGGGAAVPHRQAGAL